MKKQCVICHWFEATNREHKYGLCTYNPPTVLVLTLTDPYGTTHDVVETHFPTVNFTDGCSRHKTIMR